MRAPLRSRPAVLVALWCLPWCMASLAATAAADSTASTAPVAPAGSLIHPNGPGLGDWRLGLGAAVDILPRFLVEAELRQIPSVAGTLRWGLGHGLSLDAQLSSAFIAHALRLGAAWSFDTGPLSWSVRHQLGFWLGHLTTAGFDTTTWGFVSYPAIATGLRFDSHRLTLTGEGIVLHNQVTRFGTATTRDPTSRWGGLGVSLTAESRLGGGFIYYGVAVIRADLDYQLWLAFADNPYKLSYARLFVGYVL